MEPNKSFLDGKKISKPKPKDGKDGRGGERDGAGRPEKTGNYKEDTKAVRIPERCANSINAMSKLQKEKIAEPLHQFLTHFQVKALGGQELQNRPSLPNQTQIIQFPSAVAATLDLPATAEQDNPGELVDLHELLVRNPSQTFIVPVAGDSMNSAGISERDLIIVEKLKDRSNLKNNSIVVALVDGSQTVKRYRKDKNGEFLVPESDNPIHKELQLTKDVNYDIMGVVLWAIRSFNNRFVF
ncbi:hypothetical protein H6F86_10580 [Phormidium sp. FACHB-592]|uniref:S24 family peptidase n=1 Tax=Stenomitos frigidus AS-A4 TaxID=2933935 RepID=A0ABV0KRJ8_9CYAN|nr:S24 family peptidase [Phormidium sp. FACHB-592]MBD2074322.1 hypothetical protein [Phormidium sp. FACHB-592]